MLWKAEFFEIFQFLSSASNKPTLISLATLKLIKFFARIQQKLIKIYWTTPDGLWRVRQRQNVWHDFYLGMIFFGVYIEQLARRRSFRFSRAHSWSPHTHFKKIWVYNSINFFKRWCETNANGILLASCSSSTLDNFYANVRKRCWMRTSFTRFSHFFNSLSVFF